MLYDLCNMRAIGNGGSYYLMLANHLILLALGLGVGYGVGRFR